MVGSLARVVAGTAAGLSCHAMLAAVGLAALVMRSSEAFTTVKLVGAAYLVWLGFTTIWQARSGQPVGSTPGALPWVARGDLAQGFLGNVLNPKAAAVYLTLAPQFLRRDEAVLPQMAALLAAHLLVATSWLLLWSMAVDLGRRVLTRSPVRRAIDRLAGTILLGQGVQTAVATR